MRLGELVKIGFAKAQERTADDWQDIAAIKAKQAEDAEAKALEQPTGQLETLIGR